MIRSDTMYTAAAERVGGTPSAQAWFAGGERVGYDPNARAMVAAQGAALRVFLRREGDVAHAVSFLPGYPDGSFGWAKVHLHLPNATEMPKLFVEYVGMGDSDKPKDYAYSIAERTDLVEAIWRDLSVQSTTLVAFDFSSLVVLEHLRRRLERSERGEPAGGPEIRAVFIFNGGLFTDGHSHPWFTTPILRRLGRGVAPWVGRSFAMFKRLAGVMWSKGYRVTNGEVRELYNAWTATMACSTLRERLALWPITKRNATGSTSAASSRRIALNSRSLRVAATKIPLNTGKSTLRRNGWASSGSRSSACQAVTSLPTSSRKPWLH